MNSSKHSKNIMTSYNKDYSNVSLYQMNKIIKKVTGYWAHAAEFIR